MSEKVVLQITPTEATVGIDILQKAGIGKKTNAELLSTLDTIDQIDAAKGLLKSLKSSKTKQAYTHGNMSPAHRNTQTADGLENEKLRDRIRGLEERYNQLNEVYEKIETAAEKNNMAEAKRIVLNNRYRDYVPQ